MKILIVLLFCFVTNASDIPKSKLDRLFSLLKIEKKWEGIIVETVKRDMVNTPELKLIEKEWLGHFKKYKNWNASKEGLYNFYSKHFKESEIDELIKIYESPVITKLQRFGPLLRLEIKKVFRKETESEKKNMTVLLKILEKRMKAKKPSSKKAK